MIFMPRTIDKLRGFLPGGHPGEFVINAKIKGMSGFLFEQLGVTEAQMLDVVARAETDDDVAAWLRENVDVAKYPALNETMRRIKPKHAEDPAFFADFYAPTLAKHPHLETILEIIEADDRRLFPSHFS